MQYKIRNSSGTLGSLLRTDGRLHFVSEVPCGYRQDTAAYAACRYIRHCPQLRDRLIWSAVRLGLDPRGGKKHLTFRVRAGAAALSLPGTWALLTLSVTQGTITLKSVHLL